jgi:hypothetical protein
VNRRRMALVRGDYNAPQNFLLLDSDGEYKLPEPAVRDSPDWRYTEHMAKGLNPTVPEYLRSAE